MINFAEFHDVLKDASRKAGKVDMSEVAPQGDVPVVDQSAKGAAGYCSAADRAFVGSLPAIIFGDHTRAVKFCNEPFVKGADGIKILEVQPGWDPKYVFWALASLNIPSMGYSRHFKLLKESTIPKMALSEQQRIAGILDQADAIRTKRRASLALLDELAQSVFLDFSVSSEPQKVRFGNLVQNFRNGLSPSNSGEFGAQVLTLGAITHGRFDPTSRRAAMFDRMPEENVRVRKQDFLVCRGNGNINLVGQGVFPESDDDQVVFPDTMIACRLDADKICPPYLAALWGQRVVRQQIEAGARTTNGTFKVNQKILGEVSLPIPPLDVQQEFAARVEQINAQRALVERALEKDDELFASLQSRAFSGEL